MPKGPGVTAVGVGDPVWVEDGAEQAKPGILVGYEGPHATVQMMDAEPGEHTVVDRSTVHYRRSGSLPVETKPEPEPEPEPEPDPSTDPSNPLYKIVEVIDTVMKAIERTVKEASEAADVAKNKKADTARRARTPLRRLEKARAVLCGEKALTHKTRKKAAWSPEQREAASKRMKAMNARRREEEATASSTS